MPKIDVDGVEYEASEGRTILQALDDLLQLFERLFGWGAIPYPAGAIDYLKFPITLSGERFVEATNFHPRFGLEEIFQSLGD